MTAGDFFFISAGLSIWIVLICWVFIFFKIVKLLKKAELNVMTIKNSLKLNGLTILGKILGSAKGGEGK